MKNKFLKFYDILILTAIMFGNAIYTSVVLYFNSSGLENFGSIDDFTTSDNIGALKLQGALLIIAFLYLYIRRFDFSNWNIKINISSIIKGILLFIFIALVFDLYYAIVLEFYNPYDVSEVVEHSNNFLNLLKTIDYSVILYAILNGFYEEIFFLGICLAVKPEHKLLVFIYSLIIRYSFHTYQGNLSAIAIGFILGPIFYLIYSLSKNKNLFPFFVARTIADIMGLGLVYYLS